MLSVKEAISFAGPVSQITGGTSNLILVTHLNGTFTVVCFILPLTPPFPSLMQSAVAYSIFFLT